MGPYGDKVAMAHVLVGGTFSGKVQGFASVGLVGAVFTLTLAAGVFSESGGLGPGGDYPGVGHLAGRDAGE